METFITAPIHPTEDPDRVRQAVLTLFPDALDAGCEPDILRMTAADIRPLFTRVVEQKIRDTARGILLHSVKGNIITFHLNKQAAHSGRVNFTDGDSVLGDIDVSVGTEKPEELIRSMLGGAK